MRSRHLLFSGSHVSGNLAARRVNVSKMVPVASLLSHDLIDPLRQHAGEESNKQP